MRIEVQRSGGFAGLSRNVSVDTDRLPPEQARDIEGRVRTVEEAAGKRTASPAQPRPDAFQYDVVIEDGGKRRQMTLRDPAPAGLQDLFRKMLELQQER